MFTPFAITSATDLPHVVVNDPRRARRQFVALLVAGVVMAALGALLGLLMPAVLGNEPVWWIVIVFAIAGLVGILLGVGRRIESGGRLVGFSRDGLYVLGPVGPVPWADLADIRVVRFANTVEGRGPGGRAAVSLLASGGVNDGGREIEVRLRNPDTWVERFGDYHLQIVTLPSGPEGARGFRVVLSNAVDEDAFARFESALAEQAREHGIPFTSLTR